MKKIYLLLVALLMSCTIANAQDVMSQQIHFTCEGFHDGSVGHSGPKSPIAPPTVYLEDNTLSFVADHPEYVLYIKDEDEEVVYSTVVTSAETQVTLPTYLTGSYKIELVMGNWCFWGYITL